METHQKIATVVFLLVSAIALAIQGYNNSRMGVLCLFFAMLPIYFYRLIAEHAGIGWQESLARDFGGANHPGPYAFFFWLVFLIVAAMVLFQLSIY